MHNINATFPYSRILAACSALIHFNKTDPFLLSSIISLITDIPKEEALDDLLACHNLSLLANGKEN
jgi:hypothetical protein